MSMPQADQPLRCAVTRKGRLAITLGVETNSFALTQGWKYFGSDFARYRITNALEFAKDVKRELEREDEQGTTLLTELLDRAAELAIGRGSAWVEDTKDPDRRLQR